MLATQPGAYPSREHARSYSPNAPSRLFQALGLSTAIHAALLIAPPAYQALQPGGPVAGRTFAPPVLQVALRRAGPVPHRSEQSAPNEARQEIAKPQTVPVAEETGVEGLAYYPLKVLSKPPQALSEFVPPAYPSPGRITLRAWIASSGTIDRLEVLDRSVSEEIAAATADAFSRLRFAPGELNHAPVGTWADIVIELGVSDR